VRKLKLFFIRNTKAYFLRLNLHKIFKLFEGVFLNLSYLSKFSKWRKAHSDLPYNDFFSKEFIFDKRYKLYEFLFNYEKLDDEIIYLEFGVLGGHSFKWWTGKNINSNSRFYGFDTFEGLPEDWNLYKKGDMTTEGKIPQIDGNRHQFYRGLFQDTLMQFLKQVNLNKRLVINMDADLYSSTYFVLNCIAPFLKKGDVIIFDEFGVPTHEFKAFSEFFASYYLKYKVLAASNNYYQVAIKID